MSFSNEGHKITKDYLEFIRQETEELSHSIVFSRLLCDLGEYDKSQKYFEQLLNDSQNEDHAWIEYNIRRTVYSKDEWDEARKYYDRMVKTEPPRIKASSLALHNIGVILY
ncbi:unnamed protein product [Rotaria magnacalcarata]|uniref:Tetratricopeptide repeat protein n=1 Tax=Rotaria magnacalcarata TaxID=392030 RepID=A0A816TW98_9BILA|nr:unnamed protein product [Rotaria magnacalcarata]CAF1646952.1 unnamed protein product [Rotaria magnacalcarata]CAF2063582.1 unnamed protein product [Rotaria magnacalcarata]CAF2101596.1 unnamed protein product [Rotaria magnacalcarata]CAF2251219.1 unnamed protein product [Rotaria magnacalcarata]